MTRTTPTTRTTRKTRTRIIAAAFLGLAGLFAAGQAYADQKPLPIRFAPTGSGQVKIEVRTGAGSIVFSTGGRDNDRIDRRWVPDRYEERQVRVLVERAHYEERQVRVLVEPAHYEERQVRVLVQPAHYEERNTQVLVERGHWAIRCIPPVYKTIVDRHGRKVTVLVRAGYDERYWYPDRYETRCEKALVPDRYEVQCQKVLVPDRFEMRCEKVLVPDRYEMQCQRVLVPGCWEEVKHTVRYDDRSDRDRDVQRRRG